MVISTEYVSRELRLGTVSQYDKFDPPSDCCGHFGGDSFGKHQRPLHSSTIFSKALRFCERLFPDSRIRSPGRINVSL